MAAISRIATLYEIDKILCRRCKDCPMIRLLNHNHIIPYYRDKLCIDYCLIGSKLQELGAQLLKESRPRREAI